MSSLANIQNVNNEESPNNTEGEKLVKCATYINNEKVYECSSGISSVDKINNINNERVDIFMNNNNLTEHIKSIMGHVNDYFTKKINDEKKN
ncbi:conserved Plasmodium protein, unknown function [Plasmodium sp. gorilla clade G1]|nr:conserved Plasmodium protein, unknown function [Plasmodium sp. gorilla clade G1]